MSIMDRGGPKAYHTPSGEADRLRTIIAIYSNDPVAVSKAQAALNKHLAEHPEVARSSADRLVYTERE